MDEYEEPRRATHQFALKLSASQYDDQSALSTKKHVSALIDTISADPSLHYRTLERRAREQAVRADGSILGFFKTTFNTLFANTTPEDQLKPLLSDSRKKAQVDGLKTTMFQVYEYGTAGREQPLRRPQRIPATKRELIRKQRYANTAYQQNESIINCGAGSASIASNANFSASSMGSSGGLREPDNFLELSVEAIRTAPPSTGGSTRGAGAAVMSPLSFSSSAHNPHLHPHHHHQQHHQQQHHQQQRHQQQVEAEAGAEIAGPMCNVPPPLITAEVLFAPEPEELQQQQQKEHAIKQQVINEAAAAARGGRRGSRFSLRALQKRKSSKRLSFEMDSADEIDAEAQTFSPTKKRAALKDRTSISISNGNGNSNGSVGNNDSKMKKKSTKKENIITNSNSKAIVASLTSSSPASSFTLIPNPANNTSNKAANNTTTRATTGNKSKKKKKKDMSLKGTAGGRSTRLSLTASRGGRDDSGKDALKGKTMLSRSGKTRVKQMTSIYSSTVTSLSASAYASAR